MSDATFMRIRVSEDQLAKITKYKDDIGEKTINKTVMHLLDVALSGKSLNVSISSLQVRAARLMLSWDRDRLAAESAIPIHVIIAYEDGVQGVSVDQAAALEAAVTHGGIRLTEAGGVEPA